MAVYVGTGPEKGEIVPEEDAFSYAFNRCVNGSDEDKEEFKEVLVEWFFSGNWVRQKESEEN